MIKYLVFSGINFVFVLDYMSSRSNRIFSQDTSHSNHLRLIVLIFNLGVLHHMLNGFRSCAVHNVFTGIFLTGQFLSTYLSESILLSLLHILLGAHFLMSIKPDDWYYSYKWDCGKHYAVDSLVSRVAMLGYALIVYGTESYSRLLGQVVSGSSLLWCHRKDKNTWEFCGCTFSNTAAYYIVMVETFVILFGVCGLFVFLAGGFE